MLNLNLLKFQLFIIADLFAEMMDLESETFFLLNNVESSYHCFDLFPIYNLSLPQV